MKKRNQILVCIFLMSTGLSANACSCIGPDKFVESVQELILQVEVIGLELLNKEDKYSYSVTALRIDRILKGNYEGDTIYVLNDKGFECFHSVPNKEVGSKYIITGELINKFNMMSHRPDTLEGRILLLDLCMENILYVDGNRVKGNVTKNRASSPNLYGRLLFIINKSWSSRYYNKRTSSPKQEKLMQSMSIGKLERKLSRKDLL